MDVFKRMNVLVAAMFCSVVDRLCGIGLANFVHNLSVVVVAAFRKTLVLKSPLLKRVDVQGNGKVWESMGQRGKALE